jgi:hypothetical protein
MRSTIEVSASATGPEAADATTLRMSGDSTALRLAGRTAPTAARYDALVQELELVLIATGVIISAAYIVAQARTRGTTDHVAVRLLLGLIPAIVAVSVVLISRFDVVPDDAEQPIWLVAVVLVSGALIVGTGYRLARR